MRSYKSKTGMKLALVLLMMGLITILFSPKAHADYNDISARVPDDISKLLLANGQPPSSADLCATKGQPLNPEFDKYGKWGCNSDVSNQYWQTFPDAHQYITLSNTSFNDANKGQQPYNTSSAEFVLYTKTPGSAKNINLIVVKRSLANAVPFSDALACGNWLKVDYYDGERASFMTAADARTPGCEQNMPLSDFPANKFSEIKDANGNGTGVWKAYIVVRFGDLSRNGPQTQTSFSLGTTSGAKLGYYGGGSNLDSTDGQYPALDGVDKLDHGWINSYPTALSKSQPMRFYFRPNCKVPKGTQFSVAWDDLNLDRDDIQYKKLNVTASLWRYKDNPNQKEWVRNFTFTNPDGSYQTANANYTENYGPGQPYGYMVEFNNISGGNGISFRYPFDSGEARLPCPPPPPPQDPCVASGKCTEAGGTCRGLDVSDSGNVNGQLSITKIYVGRVVGTWTGPVKDNIGPGPTGDYEVGYRMDIGGIQGKPDSLQTSVNLKYRPDAASIRVHIRQLVSDGKGGWDPNKGYNSDLVYNCYRASCKILNVSGDAPGGLIRKGGPATATVELKNISDGPGTGGPGNGPLVLLNPLEGITLGIVGNGGLWASSVSLNKPGEPGDTTIINVPVTDNSPGSGPGTMHVEFKPTYFNAFDIGDLCTADPDVYLPFKLTPNATAGYAPSAEDPRWVNYKTWVRGEGLPDGVAAGASTTSKFYKQGGPTYASVGGGSYGNGDTYTQGSATDPAQYVISGPIAAGDTYCSRIDINYTTALFGPGNQVVPTSGPGEAFQCPKIGNRPFFKVYGNSISANGDFKSSSGNTCAGDGKLGGWFNNVSSSYQYGASSELSTLSRVNTVGVASAQTLFNRTPNELAFANSDPMTQDAYSPKLGGNYGNGPHCLPTYELPTNSPALPTTNFSDPALANGSYTTDNLSLTGNNVVRNGQKLSIFAKDVYIGGNITYEDNPASPWTRKTVPSLVIRASGNIYIDPSVTKLDGLFIAEPNGSTGGNIYTCGTASFTRMSSASLYGSCNNQLTVRGSFVARKVNLMRTYGSLRDEKPVSTYTKPPALKWYGADGQSGNCAQVYEPAEPPANVSNIWSDNWLCTETPGVELAWTWYAGDHDGCPYSGFPDGMAGCKSVATLKKEGYDNCVNWDIPEDTNTWYDNALCIKGFDGSLSFSYTDKTAPDGSVTCTNVKEPSDPHGQWASGGYYVCIDNDPLVTAPAGLGTACSNMGARSSTNRPTCAAEVFDFSPEMYMGNPPVDPAPGGRTRYDFDAITSLPPVL